MKNSGKETHYINGTTATGEQISFPLTVIKGSRPGPTLGVIAGIHGGEYCGVEAALQIAAGIEPEELSGEVRIVPVANFGGFMSRTMFSVPNDGKKLSAAFPGAAGGSFGEKLAYMLNRELIAKSDCVLEFRGGELVETMAHYTSIQRTGDEEHDKKAKALAEAFGAQNIILRKTRKPTETEPANTCATYAGKFGLLAEAGGQGLREKPDVDFLLTGTRRVMAHLGMVEAKLAPTKIQYRYFDSFIDIVSPVDGIFDWTANCDAVVEPGDKIGQVRDYSGAVLAEITAPERGVILGIVTAPGTREGETVIGIGRFI